MAEVARQRPPQKTRAWTELAAIAIGCVIALGALDYAFGDTRTRFEDLALGKQTTSVYAEVGGLPIHCSDIDDADACIRGFEERTASRAALWFGNSQIHAVNQYRPGQENGPPILFRRLRPSDVELLAFSQPNGNFQEHLVLHGYLKSRLPIRQLILSAVFDELREIGVRESLAPALDDPETAAFLSETEIGRRILSTQRDAADGDMAALDQTVQEHSETALNRWLERNSNLWASRPEARGRLFVQLIVLRNTLLGISAQSKRRLIEARYRNNMDAAAAMLADAQARGIGALVYIVPLRSDAETPYVEAEYQRFKSDMQELALQYGAAFANLENLVPAPLWGMKDATDLDGEVELDFMHFQAPGHQLLATRLGDILQDQLEGAER